MIRIVNVGFTKLKSKMMGTLMVALIFLASGQNFISPVYAASGEGTATIRLGTGGTNAGDATYTAAGASGTVTVGQKSYVRLDLTVGASDIAALEDNVTIQINPNLFPTNSWETTKEAALTDLNTVGEWFVTYTDTDSGTTNNAAISFAGSTAVNTGLITIQANQQMDSTDIISIYGVVQDNHYSLASADIDIQTDDSGADSLTQIAGPPTIATTYADAEASLTLGANSVVGAAGTLTLDITLPFALDEDDTIGMTFPASVDISNVDAAVTGTLENGNEITCGDVGIKILCTVITGPTATSGTIILTGITTLYSDTENVDVGMEDEGVAANYIAVSLNPPMTDITAADAAAIVTLTSPAIGAVGNTNLTLTSPFALDAADTIDITFPAHLDVSNVGAAVTGSFENGHEITCANAGQVVTCTVISGPTLVTGTIIITGLTARASGTADTSVQVEDEGVADNDIATDANALMTDTSVGTLVGTTLSLSNYNVGAASSATVNMTLDNNLPDDGKIKIEFLNSFNLTGASVLNSASGVDGTFTVSDDGDFVVIERNGDGTQTPGGTDLSLQFSSVVNPGSAIATDPFTFQTTTTDDLILDENDAVAGVQIISAPVNNGGGGGGGTPDSSLIIQAGTPEINLNTTEKAKTEATKSAFTDIIGHWAEAYINQLAQMQIVSGKTPTIFAPNDFITRAELTKIAVKAFNIPIDSEIKNSNFTDVSNEDWFITYVNTAQKAGIVEGLGNNLFAPNEAIDRAAALKIMLKSAGFDKTEPKDLFTDVKATEWFAGYVTFASEHGVVSGYGDGTFGPGNKITRAEASKIIVKLMEMK